MYDEAIYIVRKFIDVHVGGYKCDKYPIWPKNEFDTKSYSRWAADEILGRIMDESLKPPPYVSGCYQEDVTDIIKGFIAEMDICLENAIDERHQTAFYIAWDASCKLLKFYESERRYY